MYSKVKAIQTKFIPCGNVRGSRIKAWDSDRNSIFISYPDDCHADDCHPRAAKALCRKMGWHGTLIQGGTKDGNVFVFSSIRPNKKTLHAKRFNV